MKLRHRLATRLTGLFAIMLVIFTLLLTLLFNAMMEKQMINHYSKTMQRDAYAISQNLSEMIAPSSYDSLDENPFIVGEDTLAPYMALIEHITHCNAYLIDEQHHVTGYFDGVVQTIGSPLLPSYIEQTIALGFMGKTPFLMMKEDGDTHLTTGMPIMNAHSHVLGVVLLETTLRELGFAPGIQYGNSRVQRRHRFYVRTGTELFLLALLYQTHYGGAAFCGRACAGAV